MREMASLTKIMTCYIICEMIRNNEVDKNYIIIVSKEGE